MCGTLNNMGKFDYRGLLPRERMKLIDELTEALFTFENKKQLREFLQRLLTPSEIFMLARRLETAEGLVEGKSYSTIRDELGVGFSTIQSVDSWLEHAVRDYQEIRRKVREQQRRGDERERIEYQDIPGTFGNIRHRYPGHFLLFNLLLDQQPEESRSKKKKS